VLNAPFVTLVSRVVLLPQDNVDTDQIIPARFLKGTSREGLGQHLFADWRRDAGGAPRPEFVLNRPESQGAQVLVGGRNFGCGSSREHAVWALRDHGFRAVVAPSFGDIFRGNALKNALVPVRLDPDAHQRLVSGGGGDVAIDLTSLRITLPDGTSFPFPLEPFSRHCLMQGVDELAYLVAQDADITAHERRNPESLEGATHDV
jgi:3-isopropylmalate/(R)-2-methylmalate dehydratase small subunit